MTVVIKEESIYGAAFRRKREQPNWLARLSERALEQFEQQGFPTLEDEDWKYTNVAPITRGAFVPSATGEMTLSGEALQAFVYPEAATCRMVFFNGIFRPELSALDALPNGVVISPLSDALGGEHEAILKEHLARGVAMETDGFAALNTAFIEQGAFIYLAKGVQLAEPIHLLFLAGASAEPFAAFSRVLIVAERKASALPLLSHADLVTRDGARMYVCGSVVELQYSLA